MGEYYICKCGSIRESHGKSWCKCQEFVLMTCKTCGKEIHPVLCRYDHENDYYCIEHCPKHEWQSDFDWPSECKHCGIRKDRFVSGEVERLRAVLVKISETKCPQCSALARYALGME